MEALSQLALDEANVRAHIEHKLSSAHRVEEPAPHLVIHDFLEPSLYRTLVEAWPPLELFRRDKTGRKFDLVPSSVGADARGARYEQLPQEQRTKWDFLVRTVNREIVAPLLASIFEKEIQARLRQIKEAFEAGLVTYPMAGTRDWSYRANAGRFMIRTKGHELKPHVDGMPYLLTVLHYFSEDEGDEEFGTIFYKPERPLDFEACVRDGSTQYLDEAGVKCEEALRIPMRPNSMLAFPNTLATAHGAVAPMDKLRKVFQYHISLKGDDEKV